MSLRRAHEVKFFYTLLRGLLYQVDDPLNYLVSVYSTALYILTSTGLDLVDHL